MPSLRNPVGPLPASIYWRRRLVVLAALAAVVVLVSVLAFGGGGADRKASAGSTGSPASSLTPGPTGHGGSNDGASGGSGSAQPSAGASGSGGPTAVPSGAPVVTGSGGSAGSGTGGSGSGSTGGTSGSGTSAASTLTPNLPGTMNLPACAATDLDLSLASTAQTYRPSQFPAFQLGITNTSGSACRVDLGTKSAVLAITSDTGATVWSSSDCPKDTTAQWYAVPAAGDGPLTALFGWARTTSKPGCTPGSGGGNAPAGTYVAHIGIGGVSAQPQHWFKLAPFGS